MSSLLLTINKIRVKIKNNREIYENSEANVRSQIIEPILKSIQWDPGDPKQVLHNESIDQGIPDYSLKKRGTTRLFIEAKKMAKDIGNKEDMRQIGKYCFDQGINFGIITNGSNWILFRTYEEKTNFSERSLWRIDIENDDLETISSKFKTIARGNIENIEASITKFQRANKLRQNRVAKQTQILEDTWKKITSNPEQIIKGFIPFFKKYTKQGELNRNKINDSQISEFLNDRITRNLLSISKVESEKISSNEGIWQSRTPKKMRIQNLVFDLKNKQNEILIQTANWLIQNNKLKESDCPIVVTSGKRYLINKKPYHKDNSHFGAEKPLDNGLWLETKFNRATTINYAKKLVEIYGYPQDTIKFEY